MIKHPVVVIFFRTVKQSFWQCRILKLFHQLGKINNAGVQEFQTAHFLYIRSYHQRIHAAHSRIQLHYSSHARRQFHNTVMNKVYACHFFIGIASGTESSKRTVIQWLLLEAGCMQGVLITDVKRKGVHDFFICERKDFFQYQCSNDYIHRGYYA